MTPTAEWDRVKSRLPMGAEVRGTVPAHAPFGFFVDLEADPGATAVVDGIDYRPSAETAARPPDDTDRTAIEALLRFP